MIKKHFQVYDLFAKKGVAHLTLQVSKLEIEMEINLRLSWIKLEI